jgi:ribosomal protein S18 acetylase RimI-like enzyme
VRVRPARPEDAAAVAEVHVRTWQAAYEHVFGAERLAAIDHTRRRTLAERAIASGNVAVAEEDGKVVGFVSVGPSTDVDGEGELLAIYVLPESYSDATLYVLEDNPRARRFYEREGWALDGVTKADEFLGMPVPEVRYRISFAPDDSTA